MCSRTIPKGYVNFYVNSSIAIQFIFIPKDKQHDINEATYKLRKDIDNAKEEEKHLREEIDTLLSQLSDAKHGLLAASRLSDQLETSNQTISRLKTECKYKSCFFYIVRSLFRL